MNPIYFNKPSFEFLNYDNDGIFKLRANSSKRSDSNTKTEINNLSNYLKNSVNHINIMNRPISFNTGKKENYSINYLTLISNIRDYNYNVKNNKYKMNYYNNNKFNLFNNRKVKNAFGEDDEVKSYRDSYKIRKK